MNSIISYNLVKDQVVDGDRKGNIARFINHSCEPNAKFENALVYHSKDAKEYKYKTINIITSERDIKAGEEITISYRMSADKNMSKCLCKTSSCTGSMSIAPSAHKKTTKRPTSGPSSSGPSKKKKSN